MPLMSTSWGDVSTGISYRRIVIRNVVCAAAITLMILGRTVLTLLTMSKMVVFPYKVRPWLGGYGRVVVNLSSMRKAVVLND